MRKTKRDHSVVKAAKSALRPFSIRRLASQPDAAGLATRLAAQRLKQARIAVDPLLHGTGLSVSQINVPGTRVRVASQIAFLDRAARALNDPLLGFRLARDFDLREMGLLYYAAASSKTLSDALQRTQRYSSVDNAGVVLKCAKTGDFMIALRYAGVARHSDRQQMELLVTTVVRISRTLTNRRLTPIAVRLSHQRFGDPSEFESFLGCQVAFGADVDEVVFDRAARQLQVIGADPYLNTILVRSCEEALSHRRSNVSPLRTAIENAIAPLLPHGKARLDAIARDMGMSRRTLRRRLATEEMSFAEILDQLRSDLAKRYFAEGSLSISKIAWLVGYQGVSAFTHACKRWTGMTPREAREHLASR